MVSIVHYSHYSGCCRRSVAPWITVLSWHTVFTIGVLYKFTLVWYSAKQGTTHRPTSHLAHSYIVPFLWSREHRRQRSWVDDFAGQCLLSRLSENSFCQQSKCHWCLPPPVWTFFPAIALDTYNGPPYLHSSVWLGTVAVTQFTLLCMTRHSCNNPIPLRYERLLHWQQNRSKATMCLV